MKIRRKKKTKPPVPAALDAMINNKNFKKVELKDTYTDSSVESVFIHHSVVFDILDLVLESKANEPVPEVGGFCLGKFSENENSESYNVSLEHFVASKNVTEQNPVRLEFGPQALIELYEEQEKNPELELIAWFHTHPGHTPYLSRQDLSIHNNFFKEKYQLAIVLDSLTENYDTVFVSRKENGQLNNERSSEVWFPWKTLAS